MSKYIDEIQNTYFVAEDLGENFNFACDEVEVIGRNYTGKVYKISSDIIKYLRSKRVKDFKSAVNVLDTAMWKHIISTPFVKSTIVMLYINEVTRRCEVKSYATADLIMDGLYTNIFPNEIIERINLKATH